MIKQLEELREKHGDLPVSFNSSYGFSKEAEVIMVQKCIKIHDDGSHEFIDTCVIDKKYIQSQQCRPFDFAYNEKK